MTVLMLIGVALLFGVGVYLSAFFSGSETAYYRLSALRVAVEAEAGDRPSRRILWFVRRPAEFVSTVLIGNNVANYVVTLATGIGLGLIVAAPSEAAEIVMTLLVSPIVFLFGELVPKNTNYLMPLRSLRGRISLFRTFYYAFIPLSYPLVRLTKWFEARTGAGAQSQPLLGRPQIDDLVSHGHVGGLLSDVQAEMTTQLLSVGAETVGDSVTAEDFAFGLPESATRAELLEHARKYGLTDIPLHADGRPGEWTSGVSIGSMLKTIVSPKEAAGPLPKVPASTTKLAAVRRIRDARSGYAVVTERGRVLGLVSLHSLMQSLFREPAKIASDAG